MKEAVAPVPVIDLEQEDDDVVRAIRRACTQHGFFKVVNHGVDGSLVQRMFAENAKLFGLPLEQKMKLLADHNNRGYTPFREETLDPQRQKGGDTKEGFYFGREVPADSEEAKKPLHGPNQWPQPDLLPEYRKTANEYFATLKELAMRLVRIIALSLALSADFLASKFDAPMIMLRPLHYSADKSKPDEGLYAAGAHSDYGMITILATDENPGLQILYNNQWRNVVPEPDAFIINLGDMLERWTNGVYRSTMHRVLNLTGKERHSIAFFFEPNFDAVVECLPQCCVEEPPKYPKTTAGQHLLDKYSQTHAGYFEGRVVQN